MSELIPRTPLCTHADSDMGYLEAHWDGQKRLKRGEKQIQCKHCGLWIWEDLWGEAPDPERTMRVK